MMRVQTISKAVVTTSVVLLAFSTWATGCSKPRNASKGGSKAEEQPPAKQNQTSAQPANNNPKTPTKAAVQAPSAATSVNKPEPAKPKKKPARKYSVVPHFSVKPGGAFELPVAGKNAHVRILPIFDDGGTVGALESMGGAELWVLVARGDGQFAELRTVAKIDGKGPTFKFRFPKGGSHVAWALFRPQGGELQSVPTYFNVKGKEQAAPDDPEDGRTTRIGKIEVALSAPETISVCDDVRLASMWSRKASTLKLARSDGGPAVRYVAVDVGGSKVVPGSPVVDPAKDQVKVIGDAGTRAEFRFDSPGRWYVWAFATFKKKAKAARFFVDVKGEAKPEGCKGK